MKPILCNYYVTYRCNARCTFCAIWKQPRVPDADPAVVLAHLQDVRRLGCRFIDFTGGEPLLYAELALVLRSAKELGLVTSVTTNALLYPQRAGELAGLVDLLHFSLDADTAQLHDQLRGVASFDRVMESLDAAAALGERPDLLFTATNRNAHALEGLAALARQRGVILIVNPVFSYFDNDGLAPDTLKALKASAWKRNVYVNLGLLRLIRAGGNTTSAPRCRAVTSTVVVSPDSRLLLPCFHHTQQAVPINDNLAGVWGRSAVRLAERAQGRHRVCRGCTINCYFDPSFLYRGDGYFWESLISKAKYGLDKHVRLTKVLQGKGRNDSPPLPRCPIRSSQTVFSRGSG